MEKPQVGWREAAIEVLEVHGKPMHYTEIAEEIVKSKRRVKVGATPAATLSTAIHYSLRNDGENSPFRRIGRGVYTLRDATIELPSKSEIPGEEDKEETGLINAFGMYWSRAKVDWSISPKILGQQLTESKVVDFADQLGVYLLYDVRHVVYVGRTTDRPLGKRLREHVSDRLNCRWDRFSWFGVRGIDDKTGQLSQATSSEFTLPMLIATMEALLIEGLEPPQNRKRGDDFRAVEFLQVEDADIQKRQKQRWLDEMKNDIK